MTQTETKLPNGCTLYCQKELTGGRSYWSDENGVMSYLWDTALIDQSTLIAAINAENMIRFAEKVEEDKARIRCKVCGNRTSNSF